MKNNIDIKHFSVSILLRYSLTTVSCLILAAAFCLIPERIILAFLLFIFLILMINWISASTSIKEDNIEGKINDPYESAKEQWKKEIDQDLKIDRIIENRKKLYFESSVISKNEAHKISGKTILRLVNQNYANNIEYSRLKDRWRKEMNDQEIERRIQHLFAKIRKSAPSEYEKGIEKIQELLLMRQNCLLDSLYSKHAI